MEMRLSDWAKKEKMPYINAWRKFTKGEIDGAKRTKTGSIYVIKEDKEGALKLTKQQDKPRSSIASTGKFPRPMSVGANISPEEEKSYANFQKIKKRSAASCWGESSTSTRRNAIGIGEESFRSRFANIDDGLIPFRSSAFGYSGSGGVTVRDAVELTQKAYYNIAIFRNTIDLMTEFSVGNIYFTGGTKRSNEFFTEYYKRISLMDLQDMHFREYFRSGNVFFWPFHAKISLEDNQRIKKLLDNLDTTVGAADTKIPIKYIVLNPADIMLDGNISFSSAGFKKILNPYELQRLRDPKTEQDKQVLKNLSQKERKLINDKNADIVTIELDPERLVAIFYKKQSYEPFAVPMGFPVLDDLNWKAELKKLDKMTSRTMHQAILLVTTGAEPDKGGIDQENIIALQELFENQSVARVLIADYTTKATWAIPQIGDILDPKKYEIVDRDIREGLNNVLLSANEKFANQSIKTQIFLERLKQGRQKFIDGFLVPEMKKIADVLGFSKIPIPKYEDIEFQDAVQLQRLFMTMMERGLLTPEEGFRAIETGRLPTPEESEENQKKFLELKQKDYYLPITGLTGRSSFEDPTLLLGPSAPNSNGRPPGTTGPQLNQRAPRVLGSEEDKNDIKFSLKKVTNNMLVASELAAQVEKEVKAKHRIKKITKNRRSEIENITKLIISNEEPDQWKDKDLIKSYVSSPIGRNPEREEQIMDISIEFQTSDYLAAILLASQNG